MRILGILILLSVMAACAPLVIPRLMGYEVYNVVSGSMEPAIPVGSLVYVKEKAPEEIQEGEVLAFFSDTGSGAIITHRVVTNEVVSGFFITKGDANQEEDPTPVTYGYVIGIVDKTMPALGYLMSAMATLPGKLAAAGLVFFGFALNLLGSVLSGKKEVETEKAE